MGTLLYLTLFLSPKHLRLSKKIQTPKTQNDFCAVCAAEVSTAVNGSRFLKRPNRQHSIRRVQRALSLNAACCQLGPSGGRTDINQLSAGSNTGPQSSCRTWTTLLVDLKIRFINMAYWSQALSHPSSTQSTLKTATKGVVNTVFDHSGPYSATWRSDLSYGIRETCTRRGR